MVEECCRPNPPCRHFCRLDGHLLTGKGIIRNPDNGNEYEVLGVLAQGGMSITYLVYNYQIKKLSVLKEISCDLASVAKARELFQREARILQSLQNQGIPEFYDFFASKNYYSLIMEMVHGQSLDKVNFVNEKEILKCTWEVAKILDYLHGLPQPIIHRDIKPTNLILRYSPQEVVLIDFGAVKEATIEPGTRIATAGYSSPEQKRGLSFIQSDFYALGTTLVYLLTKKSPNAFYNPIMEKFVGLEEMGISKSVVDFIHIMTKFNPQNRPANALAVMDLLNKLMS